MRIKDNASYLQDIVIGFMDFYYVFDTFLGLKLTPYKDLKDCISYTCTYISWEPNVNFRKISVRRDDLKIKISCLPASPRISEHPKNCTLVHF